MQDTIAAIVTPPGVGAVAVVRVSGPDVPLLAQKILGCVPKVRHVHIGEFCDERGVAVDHGVALYFAAPHSFSGEHVLELQGHGGVAVSQAVLSQVLSFGARMAEAGEFSKRAFLNGKMDLAQAEAVCDLIHAGSAQAARSAVRSLQGGFSKHAHGITELLVKVRVFIEAALDFSDEDIDFLSDQHLQDQLQLLQKNIAALLMQAKQGALLSRGLKVVLAGLPNAGKSSLLNTLCGESHAIVTDVPGTTRDVLQKNVSLHGVPVQLFDTAGLRESDDVVEKIGVQRAKETLVTADRVLWVVDASCGEWPTVAELQSALGDVALASVTVVANKVDLCLDMKPAPGDLNVFCCSAKSGEGIDGLVLHVLHQVGYNTEGSEDQLSARTRHVAALDKVQQCLHQATAMLQEGSPECCAEELRLCQEHMQSLTGAYVADDLLGDIFSTFCIGK